VIARTLSFRLGSNHPDFAKLVASYPLAHRNPVTCYVEPEPCQDRPKVGAWSFWVCTRQGPRAHVGKPYICGLGLYDLGHGGKESATIYRMLNRRKQAMKCDPLGPVSHLAKGRENDWALPSTARWDITSTKRRLSWSTCWRPQCMGL